MSPDKKTQAPEILTIREAAEDLVNAILDDMPGIGTRLATTVYAAQAAIQAEQDRMFERMPGALWASEGLKLMAAQQPVTGRHVRAIAEAASWAIRTQDLFDERFAQDMMAVNLWRSDHPESTIGFPERADLVKWLIGKVEELGSRTDERADEGFPGESTNDKLVRTVEAAGDIPGVFTDEQRSMIRDPGAAGLAMNPLDRLATAPDSRRIVDRFFDLDDSEKREVMEKLGIQIASGLVPDNQRYGDAIVRAGAAGKLVELSELITALDGPGTRHDRDKRREACERAIRSGQISNMPMGSGDVAQIVAEHAPGWSYRAHWREDGIVSIELVDFDPGLPL